MLQLDLDHEDRLRPIARVGLSLWLFSEVDGCLYSNPPAYGRHELPDSRPIFAVPGDKTLYHPLVEGGILSVEEFSLVSWPLRSLRFRRVIDSSWSPTGLVVTEQGSRSVLLQSATDGASALANLASGEFRVISHPSGLQVMRVLDGGAPVLAGGGRFVIPFPSREVSGVGRIVGASSRSVLVEHRADADRIFRRLSQHSDETLRLPAGWEPVQGALGTNDAAIVTCLHPDQGYGIWCEDTDVVTPLPGTPQLFGLEASAPILRVAGAAEGSVWRQDSRRWLGAAEKRPDLSAEKVSIDGMPCVHLRGSRNSQALVIAFHGGPDSHEWDDLRYGGVYRALVDGGRDVLIVNAPGTAHLGRDLHREAWGRWRHAAESTGRSIAVYCESAGYVRRLLLGVSFGAWFAALSAEASHADGIVAMAPILRLAPHLSYHSGEDEAFADWAGERFGPDLSSALEGDMAIARSGVPLAALIPEGDEVVLRRNALPVRSRALTATIVSGRHYPQTLEDARARWSALLRAIEAFDSAHCPSSPSGTKR